MIAILMVAGFVGAAWTTALAAFLAVMVALAIGTVGAYCLFGVAQALAAVIDALVRGAIGGWNLARKYRGDIAWVAFLVWGGVIVGAMMRALS